MLILPILTALLLLAGWCAPRRWGKSELKRLSLFFVLLTAVGRPCLIPTGSMEPTVRSWDWVWLSHLDAMGPLKRGDVVVFPGPDGRLFCKRLIGLGGDTLEMRQGTLLINGHPWDAPEAVQPQDENWGPRQVPANGIFLMGDNRANSSDSRSWGVLPRDFVMGKVRATVFPPQHWRRL